MFYLLSFLLCLFVSGLFLTIRAAFIAPEGFEDEGGFHLSSAGAPSISARAVVVSLGSREALICL